MDYTIYFTDGGFLRGKGTIKTEGFIFIVYKNNGLVNLLVPIEKVKYISYE